MNHKIIPAIMPKTYEELESLTERIAPYVDHVQFDIMDGDFVSDATWPFQNPDDVFFEGIVHEEDDLPYADTLSYELDLMVREPAELLAQWKAMKPQSIIIHAASCDNVIETLQDFQVMRDEDTALGLSMPHGTTYAQMAQHIPYIDIVQCMGIKEIGKQGEPFASAVLDQIQLMRKHFPHIIISVDGSVNKETITDLKDAGAQRFVVGSAIFGASDVEKAIADLEEYIS